MLKTISNLVKLKIYTKYENVLYNNKSGDVFSVIIEGIAIENETDFISSKRELRQGEIFLTTYSHFHYILKGITYISKGQS